MPQNKNPNRKILDQFPVDGKFPMLELKGWEISCQRRAVRIGGRLERLVKSVSHTSRSARSVASAVFFLAYFALATPCNSENFTAKAVGVTDGDTITVLHDGEEEVIRLNGFDCPEKNQAYGKKAKKFTSDRVLQKIVTVEAKDVDRDGRTVGDVFLADGTNLNHELVREGLAWWFFKYSATV